MTSLAVLLADGGWIGLAVFIVFVIFSVLSKVAGQFQEAQKEAMRRARTKPPEPARRPSDSLEDEIAEFLRRAAERQKPGQAQAERPRPAQAERPAPSPPPPPLVADEGSRPFRSAPPQPAAEPVEAEVLVAVPAERETVAEHVQDRFGRPKFGQVGSAGLGKEVADADERSDERLRERFGRQVSRLAASPGEKAAAPAVVGSPVPADRVSAGPMLSAAAIGAILANPATLRQAILVSEILQRPEERWRR